MRKTTLAQLYSAMPERYYFSLLERNNAESALFYISFAIYLFAYIMTGSTFSADYLYTVIKIVACLMLILKLILQKYTPLQFLAVIAFASIGMLSILFSHDESFALLILFVAASRGISVKSLAKIVFTEAVMLTILLVLLSQLGIVRDITNIGAEGIRHSWGFAHPNRFGSILLAICCAWATIRFPDFKLADVIFCLAAFLLAWKVAYSRTSSVLILATIIAALLFSMAKTATFKKRLLGVLPVLFLACVAISIAMTLAFSPEDTFLSSLNSKLSDRLLYAKTYFNAYPPLPFGRDLGGAVVQVGSSMELVLDIGYDRLLLCFGYIPFTIFCAAYFFLFYSGWRHSWLSPCIMGAFIYAVAGTVEWQVMHFAYNYFLIGIAEILYNINKT